MLKRYIILETSGGNHCEVVAAFYNNVSEALRETIRLAAESGLHYIVAEVIVDTSAPGGA